MKNSKTLSKDELIIFSRQLALVIDSDISLYKGLSLIKEKSDNPSMERLIKQMLTSIGNGKSLSEAMAEQNEAFPIFIRTMIKIGEESGELSNVLNQIADAYERDIETSSKVRAAITYPLILAVLMFGVILLLVFKVLPMFNDILESLGGEMPYMTRIIMSFSLWLGKYLIPIVILLGIIYFALFYYAKTAKGKKIFDTIKYHLPIQGNILSALTAVRFSRNLSLLIKSGVNIGMGMDLVAPIFDNHYVAEKIKLAARDIKNGEMPDKSIEKLSLFPWVLIKLFAVAQSTGHMDTMLDKAANTMEKELNYRLDRLTTVIEPLLIIILSCIVGVILISVILPIVGIMNAIG